MSEAFLIFGLTVAVVVQTWRAWAYRRRWKRAQMVYDDALRITRKANDNGIQWMNKYFELKDGPGRFGDYRSKTLSIAEEWPEEIQ